MCLSNCVVIHRVTLNTMPEVKLKAKVVVLVGHDLVEVMTLPTCKADDIGVVQGRQFITTIIIVVLHDLVPLLHHPLDTCLFIRLPLSLLSLFGVRGIGDLGLSRETPAQVAISKMCNWVGVDS